MLRRIFLICWSVLLLAGCKEELSDRLYVLKLDHPPTTVEWERALPRLVTVRGGRPHKLPSFAEIDEDTVHVTTASCHHGSRLPDPIKVDMRAFYTARDLYLRLVWKDATPDRALMEWTFDGARWKNSGSQEDGFGLMWDPAGQFAQFTCSYACHIKDFGVSRSSFHASNKMRLAQEDAWLDLWNWKADRTARYGFADDRFLDQEGMKGDVPGEIFRPNSRQGQAAAEAAQPFGDNDQPLHDDDHRPIGEGNPLPGRRAPGYLVERPTGGRADVVASAEHRNGTWRVVLRRALDTGDRRDVTFVPGDSRGIAFGLAVMDHTLFEHYASVVTEKMVLLNEVQAAELKDLNAD
ncbi:MAG: ethylbenzene dehydrogenase-related protein [Desulfuromonadales bacterium]|nr:ethylbenzene dehydrogenase-related protein [Desulfuromonadales bacterium]